MTLRLICPDDAPALLDLWTRSAPLDPLTPALLYEKLWGDAAFDPEAALAAEADGALVGMAVGVLWPTPDALRGTTKMLAVEPGHRRRGVGSALLAAVEARLVARGATALRVAEASPNYLCPGIDVRYTPGWLMAQARGYAFVAETYNLDVDLAADDWSTAEAERALGARGVEIRRATPADAPAVGALLGAHWPAWTAEVSAALGRTPPALHLALRGTDVLAFSAYDANNVGTGWFGPMGTDPAARGLGAGGVLLRRCLADMAAQGHARAVIPWVGPVGFYSNHAGATIARVFHRVEKAVPRDGGPPLR